MPNGTYSVHLVSGDACCTDSAFRVDVEGVLALSGTPTETTHWGREDGQGHGHRRTPHDLQRRGLKGRNNKLNYVDISTG